MDHYITGSGWTPTISFPMVGDNPQFPSVMQPYNPIVLLMSTKALERGPGSGLGWKVGEWGGILYLQLSLSNE